MRALLLGAALTGCAASLARVSQHSHARADLGRSCAETCAPGSCDSSYDLSAAREIRCDVDAERFALCICRPPAVDPAG